MTAAILAILSAVAGAIANLLARGISRFATTREYLAANFALMFLMLLPAAPFFWQLSLRWEAIAALLAAAIIDLAANYFYFRSFEALDAVTASSILSLSPVIALFFVPLFQMGQGIGPGGFAGIALVSAGLIALSRGANGIKPGVSHQARGFWLPLAAALLFGLNVFVIKMLFNNDWCNPYTYYLLRALVVALVGGVLFRPNLRWLTRSTLLFSAGRLIIVITQWMLLLAALEIGNPAGVKALADSSPLFVVMLSGVLIKERLQPWRVLGAVLVIGGIGLITLASS